MEMENYQHTESCEMLVALPKHIPFPEVPYSSEIVNELITFVFVLFTACMQFMHIYRTVWWLPDSYTNHSLNFHLIDPYLVLFIAVMVSRRFLFSVMNVILELICQGKVSRLQNMTAKCIFMVLFTISLGYNIVWIYKKQNYLCIFLLLYPFVMYLLIFGGRIEPLMRTTNSTEATYMNGIPMHCCSTNPTAVRDEIEMLKNDFNDRFKQTLFTSVINAYYAGFVPCFFAQNFLYYDVLWATQYIVLVWVSGFTMYTVFCFPSKYCDVMHRAALHLGRWTRVDGRINSNQPPATWSKSIGWPSGSIVRYNGDLYKSTGAVTLAIPGNLTHYRFYKLFNNPSGLYTVLTTVQIALILGQLLIMCFSIEWHKVISLCFLILTNQHTLFKHGRDLLVTQKVYAAEVSIYEKLDTHYH